MCIMDRPAACDLTPVPTIALGFAQAKTLLHRPRDFTQTRRVQKLQATSLAPPVHDKSIPIAPRRRNHGFVCANGIVSSGAPRRSPTKAWGLLWQKPMHRPRGCTNTVGTGVPDCPKTDAPHQIPLVAATTGMYVQMGSFPREHQGAPLPRLGACFGKNRCRDHGFPPGRRTPHRKVSAPSGARRVPNVYKLGIDKNKIILYNER